MSTLTILRTDTVFAKLPIHNLTKSAPIDIRIHQANAQGVHELYWSVSPSLAYGSPQLLAYKLDTLVINRHLDALKRPLPSLICLGSLRRICQDLGLSKGKSTGNVKRALHQNAGVYITAKLRYRDREGKERRLEAGFNRYGVIFTGESLPDGSRADAVYVILHEVYRQVLNSAPTRPIDYDYLTELKPLAQRFYELLSFKMYAALKYQHRQVSMRYSELCQFAPQYRHTDGTEMSKQMSRVHQPHLHSDYLASVETERVVDAEGCPDWLLYYIPGPKAQAHHKVFTGRQSKGRSLRTTGTDELAPSLFDDSGVEALDIAAADRPTPQSPPVTDDTQCGPDPVPVGDSPEFCVNGPHPVSASPQMPPVTERMTVDESPTSDPESTPSATDLVQHFHREFHGVADRMPDAKELEHAMSLMEERGPDFPMFFLEYACQRIRETNFKPMFFGGLMVHKSAAVVAYDKRHHHQQQQATQSCALCNQNGLIEFERLDSGDSFSTKCPHDEDAIGRYEATKGCQRI